MCSKPLLNWQLTKAGEDHQVPENNQLENIELRLQRLENLVLEDVMEMLRRMENKIDVVAFQIKALGRQLSRLEQ